MSNDRLKFRVWWKKQNRYLRNPVLIFGKIGTGTEIFEDGKLTQCVRTDETEIEQCTGLRDKNGNLLYENDVILFDGDKYIIKWYESFWYIEKPIVERLYDFMQIADTNTSYYEIVGNVHTQNDTEQKDLING